MSAQQILKQIRAVKSSNKTTGDKITLIIHLRKLLKELADDTKK